MPSLRRALALVVSVAAVTAFAETDPLVAAIARAQGCAPELVRDASISNARHGWIVKWTLEVGEGGTDRCTSTYGENATLSWIDCDFVYVSHSMGPEDARRLVRVFRIFDEAGALVKVSGTLRVMRLSDSKVVTRRAITKSEDDALADLSKPLLVLDSALTDATPLALAIARSQPGRSPASVRAPTLTRAGKSWVVTWRFAVGDSGEDVCTSTFRGDGSLSTLDCTVSYSTHAMAENSRWVTHAVRTYDPQGSLLKVTGTVQATRLTDGKVVEKRALKPDGDDLADMSEPMLTLDPELRK